MMTWVMRFIAVFSVVCTFGFILLIYDYSVFRNHLENVCVNHGYTSFETHTRMLCVDDHTAIVYDPIALDKKNEEDRHYGCKVENQAPNGECK